ncbi:hypothetical protein [Steroidobacter agaridevorans]|uniref:hypothetical protein n=1 Tax=Steroidobacter agaridevorans TaxID=2695856 RepID=UPI00132C421D|nr:hypothetical protein [Steroidobacter agaridevorans]GFE91051.1 hypothetical protein GCM10011488_60050 [Steroidobacter agaridevorans]
MAQLDKLRNQLEAIHLAFEKLEQALEHSGLLLPTTEEMVVASRAYVELEELPEQLRDPAELLKRGRRVEKEGLSLMPGTSSQQDSHVDGEFALAARNGGKLNDVLLARMHADRAAIQKRRS